MKFAFEIIATPSTIATFASVELQPMAAVFDELAVLCTHTDIKRLAVGVGAGSLARATSVIRTGGRTALGIVRPMGSEFVTIEHGVALVLTIVGASAFVIAVHHGGFVGSSVREIQRAAAFATGGRSDAYVPHLFKREWFPTFGREGIFNFPIAICF